MPSTTPISSDHNGVVAFMTPATPESTVRSPIPKRANGSALQKNAATTSRPHVRRSRGRRWRVAKAMASSVSAPSAQRTSVRWTGLSPVRASLIQRKPDPHSRASTAMRTHPVTSSTVPNMICQDK
ncbi:Uncharacterised protein [Amycolatopsis camponoti]|uniref:Uncharacterized protein n=1 Tax=Amycolatopsis camponoti TaxID=2606593 RepID=A0A6I8LE67_9PSEU|nr:Uncharacterised protein [Amycolatopsis camponoti]